MLSVDCPPDCLCLTETWSSEHNEAKKYLATGHSYQEIINRIKPGL